VAVRAQSSLKKILWVKRVKTIMQWSPFGLRCMVVVREGFELLSIFARMTDRIPAKKAKR
jgi:hypothetical protein